MKHKIQAVAWLILSSSVAACPFANSFGGGGQPPNDAVHRQRLRRRLNNIDDQPKQRLLQVGEGCVTEDTYDAIFSDILSCGTASPTPAPLPTTPPIQAPTVPPTAGPTRDGDCLTEDTYDAIFSDIEVTSNGLTNNVERSHFLGGIVRLAAHDFMDFDRNDPNAMGADGCIDWDHAANSGLDTIWCDDGTCPLTEIYNEKYSFMSRADYWVAASEAVIKLSSPNNELDLKSTFKWGRVDAEQCPEAALRLPGDTECGEVENVFLTRLGLSWTDAVALLGAHTLGRGSSDFSGHDGIWVDTNQEATVFDKRYYEEVLRRAWVPRNQGTSVQDWTWGGGNNGSPRFMLNTDMCLLFDIESTFPCCSRTDLFGNDGNNQCNRGNNNLAGIECGRTSNVETEAAMVLFSGERDGGGFNNDNGPFFDAFSEAWQKATTNGWEGNLHDFALSCGTASPTPAPLPTTSPIQAPTVPPTAGPTRVPSTQAPSPGPTRVITSPTETCVDVDSLIDKGRTRDCAWVIANQRCQPYSHLCPLSCGECECLLQKSVCTSGEDCCSGSCVAGQCACLSKNVQCTSNDQCCSDVCRDDGTCSGKQRMNDAETVE
eukprot:CAMPEP_0201740636 /NCGR_PEP_ID=MMETSP0593-20130828/46404_1 /ASSEMBLY_ACC=CAM_ASM_000672 /TAXON_ID=267983 /ORGANISM="Skeletonema japonicum, Strain CCMP2506" /LENGTH=600 /DNA_ID=CAMNT_0048234957 /DNA_START=99 /DNA_END=1901 /DNA_ORIENTATION=-